MPIEVSLKGLATAIGKRLSLSGGVLSGFLTLHASPTANLHAATKQYVDNAVAGVPQGILGRRFGFTCAVGIGSSNRFDATHTLTASGSAGSVVDNDGVYVAATSSTGTGAVAGWIVATSPFRRRHAPKIRIRWRTQVDITNLRFWVGCFSVAPTTSDDPTGHVAALRYSVATGGAGDTTLRVLTKDGTTLNNVDSGVSVAATTLYDLLIDMSDPTKIVYSVNGAVVATVTTNLPGIDTDLLFTVRVVNGDSGAFRVIGLSSLVWESK